MAVELMLTAPLAKHVFAQENLERIIPCVCLPRVKSMQIVQEANVEFRLSLMDVQPQQRSLVEPVVIPVIEMLTVQIITRLTLQVCAGWRGVAGPAYNQTVWKAVLCEFSESFDFLLLRDEAIGSNLAKCSMEYGVSYLGAAIGPKV